MFIIKHRKIFYIITALLVVFSIGSMIVRGLNFGIDFTGGSILEVSYANERPNVDEIKTRLDGLDLGVYSIRPTGEKAFTLRTKELGNEAKVSVLNALSPDTDNPANEDRFNTIGPVVGKELRNKSYVAIGLTVLGIVLFVTYAFRKVSQPVQSWKYGLITIISLVHDIVFSAGIFIALSYYTGAEIDLLFMSALLAILGYSVHDTIVVFDRVRENQRINQQAQRNEDFEHLVGRSVSQTMGRSINTSLTLLLVLVVLYFLGGASTQPFTLLLLLGVFAGTYSSVCIASPLLVTFEKLSRKKS